MNKKIRKHNIRIHLEEIMHSHPVTLGFIFFRREPYTTLKEEYYRGIVLKHWILHFTSLMFLKRFLCTWSILSKKVHLFIQMRLHIIKHAHICILIQKSLDVVWIRIFISLWLSRQRLFHSSLLGKHALVV